LVTGVRQRLGGAAWPWARRAPAEGRKETPAVGDLTAGALSRRNIRRGREGEPRRTNRLMRKRCVDNYRRLKFRRCDIFAKVRCSRRGGMSVRSALDALGMMRASRRGRGFRRRLDGLDGLGGHAGLGRWHVRGDRRKRRGCCRMYGCRWWLRAVRQEVGIQRDQAERKHCPDHQEVSQDQHHCPLEPQAPRHSYLVAPPICGVHLQRMGIPEWLILPRTGGNWRGRLFLTRAGAGAAARNPERATWQMKTRLRFLPAGPR
jgi:hypothetical protein